MKRIVIPTLALVVYATAQSTLFALPRAAESRGTHYLLAARDLNRWHAGGHIRSHSRDVEVRGMTQTLKMKKAGFFVAYDVQPWFAVFGTIGYADPDLNRYRGSSDQGEEYGGGAWINLIDHDLVDNLSLENRIRLQGLGQITRGSPSYGDRDLTYTEVHGMLTLSLINELVGNKEYWPESVSLFGGLAFNDIRGADFNSETDQFGLVFGSDVQLSRRVSVSFLYETYNNGEAMTGSLSVRF